MIDQPGNNNSSKARAYERNMLQTAKGGSFMAMGNMFAYGSRFVIAFFLARLLGAEDYGVYNLAISAAAIVSGIATLGLHSTMVRYVAMQVKMQDEEAVWGTIQIGVGLSFVASLLMSAGLYLLAQPVAEHLFNAPQLAPFLQLFSWFIPFATVSSVLVNVAEGFKRMDYSALAKSGVLFVSRLVLIGILSISGLTAYKAVFALGLADVAVTVAILYLLNKEFPFRRPLRQANRGYREIIRFAFPFWVSSLMTRFRKNLQTLLLGSLNTLTSVGIFTIVSRLNMVGHLIFSSLIASVKPILAGLYRSQDRDQMRHLYQTTTRWTFMSNLPIFMVMALYPEQLLSIFGQSFTGGATALIVVALGELVNSATGICGSIIDMTGRTRLKLVNSVIWMGLSLGLNVLLIPRWGVLGTATAAFVSISTVNLLRMLEVWFILGIHPYNSTFLKPILAAGISYGSVFILGQWLSADTNPWYAAIHMATVIIVYIAMILLLKLEEEERTLFNRSYKRATSMVAPFLMNIRPSRRLAPKK